MQTAIFSDLHCEACVKLITKRLEKLPGITSVAGDVSGIFEIESTLPYTKDQILQTMVDSGYTLVSIE